MFGLTQYFKEIGILVLPYGKKTYKKCKLLTKLKILGPEAKTVHLEETVLLGLIQTYIHMFYTAGCIF